MLNFLKFSSYCSLKPLWSGMGEVVPARTLPTLHPPSPPYCASIVATSTLRVKTSTVIRKTQRKCKWAVELGNRRQQNGSKTQPKPITYFKNTLKTMLCCSEITWIVFSSQEVAYTSSGRSTKVRVSSGGGDRAQQNGLPKKPVRNQIAEELKVSISIWI